MKQKIQEILICESLGVMKVLILLAILLNRVSWYSPLCSKNWEKIVKKMILFFLHSQCKAIPFEKFSKNFAFSIWNTSLNLHSFFGIFLTLYVLASSSWHGLHEMVQQLLLLHLLDGVSQIKFDIRFHEFLLEFLFIYWFRYFFPDKKKIKIL